MDLINKQYGLFPIHPPAVFCLTDDFFHVLLSGGRGVDLGKFCAGSIGNDFCQSGFACARRAVENDRAELVGLDGAVQQLILPYDMLLACDLL